MKTFGIIAFIYLQCMFLFAQNNEENNKLKIGKVSTIEGWSVVDEIIGKDEAGTYVLAVKMSMSKAIISHTIMLYDNNMNMKQIRILEFGKNFDNYILQSINLLNGKLYVYSTKFDAALDSKTLFVQTLDKKTFNISKREKVVTIDYSETVNHSYDIDYKILEPIRLYGRSQMTTFQFEYSADSSKFLIYYNLAYKTKKNEKFGVLVFNQSLDKLWEKTVTLPYYDDNFNIENYSISNSGKVYFSSKLFYSLGQKKTLLHEKKKKPNYDTYIHEISNYGVKEYKVEYEDKFLGHLQFAFVDNKVLIAGSYSFTSHSKLSGILWGELTNNGSDISLRHKRLPLEFYCPYTSEYEKCVKDKSKYFDKKTLGIGEFTTKSLHIGSNGDLYLIGESVPYWPSNFVGIHGVVIFKIDRERKFSWVKFIPRLEFSSGWDYFSGYVPTFKNDKFYLFYNDNIENVNKEFTETPKALTKIGLGTKCCPVVTSNFVLTTIDSNGDSNKIILLNTVETETMLWPKSSHQVTNDEVIFYFRGVDKERILKYKIK